MTFLVNAAAFVVSILTVFFLFFFIALNTPKSSKPTQHALNDTNFTASTTSEFPLDFPHPLRKGHYEDRMLTEPSTTTMRRGFFDFFKIFGFLGRMTTNKQANISTTHKYTTIFSKLTHSTTLKTTTSKITSTTPKTTTLKNVELPKKGQVFDYFMGFVDVTHTLATTKKNATTISKSNATSPKSNTTNSLISTLIGGNTTTPKGSASVKLSSIPRSIASILKQSTGNVFEYQSTGILHNMTTVQVENKITPGISTKPNNNLTTENENMWDLLLDIFKDATTESSKKPDNDSFNDVEDDLTSNHTNQKNETNKKWRALAIHRMRYLMDSTGVMYAVSAAGIISSILLIFIPSAISIIVGFFFVASMLGAFSLALLNLTADSLPDSFIRLFSPL